MAKDAITFRVETLVDNIKPYQIIKTQAVKDILKEGGFKIETDAKRLAPVKHGRLRASISTNWSGSSMSRGKVGSKAKADDGVGRPPGKPGMVVFIGTNVDYAVYQEFGTKKMSARPFLHPAYWGQESEILRRISVALKKPGTLL